MRRRAWWLVLAAWGCDDGGPAADDARVGDAAAVPDDGRVADARSDATEDAAVDGAPATDAGPADARTPDSGGLDAHPADAAGDAGDAAEADVAEADATPLDAAPPDAAPCIPAEPWTRGAANLGQVAVLTELFVEPVGDGRREYVEVHNPLAIDLDLSGWRLDGAVTFDFAEGTFLAAGGHLVVAASPEGRPGVLGPWQGRLQPDEAIELSNGRGQRMESVTWGDSPLWPAVPPEGGALVRADLAQPGDRAEAWALGTPSPGEAGGIPTRQPLVLLEESAAWRVGEAWDPAWSEPDFDDGAWRVVAGPFFAGGAPAAPVRVRVTADNHYAAFVGALDGTGLRPVGQDVDLNWTTADDHDTEVAAGEHLFLAAWEAVGDAGSPQMLIAQASDADGVTLATDAASFEAVLGPPGTNPGPGGAPGLEVLAAHIALADAEARWQAPVSRLGDAAPWGGALAGAFDPAAAFVWLDTFDPASATNVQETFALFRSVRPIGRAMGSDLGAVPAVALFRSAFDFDGPADGWRLQLELAADDGAVVYLNGIEVHRQNVGPGELGPATPALGSGGARAVVELDPSPLRPGANLLAVAVVQAPGDADDLRFSAILKALPLPTQPLPPPDASPVVFSEIMYHPAEGDEEWLELHNRGEIPVDLSGWTIVDGVGFTFSEGTVLAPGAALVVARDDAAFRRLHPDAPLAGEYDGALSNDGERIALLDACGREVDALRWHDEGRWPAAADGGGSSLELRDLRADNSVPEAWVASDEGRRAAWQALSWRGVVAPSVVGPDHAWRELVLGLLDAGEVLIDDVRVVREPAGAAQNLIQNGTFDAGTAAWRVLGTHGTSVVVPDPDDPANPVLRLVATGPTEHMHNHIETTFAGGAAVENGIEYEISMRVRWVAGSDQLNVRLYFNRLARTLRLGRPGPGGTPGAPNSRAAPNTGPTFRGFAHLPVVPGPHEPATVGVAIDDPDGVAAATLWVRSDGGEPEPIPMATTDGRLYLATAPGRPQGSIVQLWVEATDTAGASATWPAAGPASRVLYPVDRPQRGPGGLPALRILLTAEDNEHFHRPTELMSNAFTRTTAIFNESEVFYDIGVRAKGSQRGRPVAVRLGYNLRFDPTRPFRGVFQSIAVDRSEGVRFGQRELLMDLVMARAGAVSAEYNDLAHIIAPRAEQTGPAVLQLARFSNDTLDARFENGSDGALYEYELIYFPTTTDDGTPEGQKRPQPDQVVGTGLRDLGLDPEAWRWNFLIKNNREADDFEGIMRLGRLFALPDADFQAQAADVIDIDEWLRSAAFASLAGAIDHYGAGAQHNTWFYVRPDDGRLLYFPHDMDFYPAEPTQPLIAQRDTQRLVAVPAWRRIFYRHLQHILATAYNDAYMARWRDQLSALLPGQDFAAHHRFLVARAQWITEGAPDAINRAFPPVGFALTTPPGEVVGDTAPVEGTAGLDVAIITVNGEPTEVTWLDPTRWQVDVALELGPNLVEIQALAEDGQVVGEASVELNRVE